MISYISKSNLFGCPSTGMDKEDVVHIYMEYYSAIKKYEITPFSAIKMNLEIVILSELSQREKGKYHMIRSYLES